MPKIALVHSQDEFSTALTDAVREANVEWTIDDLSTDSRTDRIYRLLSRDYDLIQTDETLGNGVLAAVIGNVTGTPFVICLRGWGDMLNAHAQYGVLRAASIRARSTFVLRSAAKVMTLGTHTQRKLWDDYQNQMETAESVPRPLDVQSYQANAQHNAEEPPFELVTVTNLRYAEKLRGVQTILEGIGPLLSDRPELTYRIAGGGRHLSALEQTVTEHPNADQIQVLGYSDDVPGLLADAHVFLYASYLDAYPTVILEAQSAGLPIVAADASGVSDAVAEAGLLCDPTPADFERATRKVIENDSFRFELAARSRQRMSKYNEQAAHRYSTIWQRAIEAPSTTPLGS